MADPVRVVGIAWYRREDYARIRALMADGATLPESWDKWFYRAEKVAREVQKHGLQSARVHIEPDSFPDWCAARGLELNADARSQFAHEAINGPGAPRPTVPTPA